MPRIQLVIPCFNEERRLAHDALVAFLQERPTVRVCLVNDGSTDGTIDVIRRIQEACPERVDVVDLQQNVGKAEAVRHGVVRGFAGDDFDYVGYFDADLATPLEELDHLLQASGPTPRHLLIFGSRLRHKGAHIDRNPIRYWLGRAFTRCARLTLGLPFHDTQCGAKLFERRLAKRVFDQPFISRWLFDLELFLRARDQLGAERFSRQVLEVPLRTWREKGESRIRRADWLDVPADLLRIRARYIPLVRSRRLIRRDGA